MACFSSLVQKLVESRSRPGGVGAGVLGEMDEGAEFLVGERLDRDGVVRAAALAEGFELEGEGDQRFPGAGGGVEDDVVAGEEFEDRFFLVVVGLGVGGGEVVEKGVEDVVRGCRPGMDFRGGSCG